MTKYSNGFTTEGTAIQTLDEHVKTTKKNTIYQEIERIVPLFFLMFIIFVLVFFKVFVWF